LYQGITTLAGEIPFTEDLTDKARLFILAKIQETISVVTHIQKTSLLIALL